MRTNETTAGVFPALTILLGLAVAGLTVMIDILEMGGRADIGTLAPLVVGTVLGTILAVPLLMTGLAKLIARLRSRPLSRRSAWKTAFAWKIIVGLTQGMHFSKRERAVRRAIEHEGDYASRWQTIRNRKINIVYGVSFPSKEPVFPGTTIL